MVGFAVVRFAADVADDAGAGAGDIAVDWRGAVFIEAATTAEAAGAARAATGARGARGAGAPTAGTAIAVAVAAAGTVTIDTAGSAPALEWPKAYICKPPAPATIQPAAPMMSAMARAATLTQSPLRLSTMPYRPLDAGGVCGASTVAGAAGPTDAMPRAATNPDVDGCLAWARAPSSVAGVMPRAAYGGSGRYGRCERISVAAKFVGRDPMHSMQNFATERFSVPHAGQVRPIQCTAWRVRGGSIKTPPL